MKINNIACDKCNTLFEVNVNRTRIKVTSKYKKKSRILWLIYQQCPACKQVFQISIENQDVIKLQNEIKLIEKKIKKRLENKNARIDDLVEQRNTTIKVLLNIYKNINYEFQGVSYQLEDGIKRKLEIIKLPVKQDRSEIYEVGR